MSALCLGLAGPGLAAVPGYSPELCSFDEILLGHGNGTCCAIPTTAPARIGRVGGGPFFASVSAIPSTRCEGRLIRRGKFTPPTQTQRTLKPVCPPAPGSRPRAEFGAAITSK